MKEKDKDRFPDFIYPRSRKLNRKKPNYGQLPLNIPEVRVYLSDLTYRKKDACKNLFLYSKTKENRKYPRPHIEQL